MVDFPFASVQCSFRGILFQIQDERVSGGRRGPDHQYPFRDTPWAEDTGRRQRRFPIIGWVLGDTVGALAQQLVAACETKGPGALVHPWLGTVQVVCRTFETEERWDEQRIIYFRMEFVESGQVQYPTTANDTQAATKSAASSAQTSVTNDYVDDTASVNAGLA